MPDIQKIDDQQSVIVIYIAGAWSAEDFSQVMRSLNDIYNLSAVLAAGLLRDPEARGRFFGVDRRKVRRLARTRIEAPWLVVRRLHYASPGVADLAGIGTLVGHVKDFLLGILDRFQNRHIRKAELQEKIAHAERAKFETDFERENKLIVARRDEQIYGLELRCREANVLHAEEGNRALMLQNFERETEFAVKMVRLCRENELTPEQMVRVVQWIRSRESPLIELVELNQIVDVQDGR
jgi:hypothetical protein